MQPHTEPCEMCGKTHSEYERRREREKINAIKIKAFVIGRRSVRKLSSRENDIIDAFYDLDIRDLSIIADHHGISRSACNTYYDRAMDKLMDMDFEL